MQVGQDVAEAIEKEGYFWGFQGGVFYRGSD